MKTALSILQSVRYRINLTAPTTLLSLNDPDKLQQLYALYAVLEELRQKRIWPQQKRKYSFSTANGVASYQLPPDFYSLLPGTQWNQDENLSLIGPVSDAEFTIYTQGDAASTINYTGRIFGFDENPSSDGGQFEITPTPTGAVNLYFEYVSRNLLIPKHWTSGDTIAAGAYVNANGQIYSSAGGGTAGSTAPTGTGTGISDGTISDWASYSSPYETVLADTDLVLFDADLVALGVRAKIMEDQGSPDWQSAAAEYQSKIDAAATRYYGIRTGHFSRRYSRHRYAVPGRGWSI